MINVSGGIGANGIKLKADRLYKRLVCGGLILGCVSWCGWIVRKTLFVFVLF